jgi:hypothetical protein
MMLQDAAGLVLDGVYRRTEAQLIYAQARTPTDDELKGLLDQIVAWLRKLLTWRGYLVEEQGMTYLTDTDADHPSATLQAASWPCRPRRARVARPLARHTVHWTVRVRARPIALPWVHPPARRC